MCTQSNETAQKNINEDFPLALPTGTILAGQYTIEKVLGQGGFGITYVATDYKTNQKVAVKEFFPDSLAYREMTTVISYPGERTENYDYGKENFLGEAKTLAEFIGCENIVRIFSYFEENGTAYFVMEYIEGVSFDKYLKNKGGRISCDEAKNILVPVMEALAIVHSKGIVHRDVTPDNIYITSDGKVKLLDFGAARYSLGDKSKSLDVILKHGFAPKEQYTRRGKQGPFTDIYSLGATFYFAVTGRRPPDSIDRLEDDELIPPSSLGVKITSYQEEAILHALEVNPQSRYQSMLDFRNVLLNETAPAPQAGAVTQQFFNAPPTPAAMPVQQQIPYTAQQIPYTAQQIPYTQQQPYPMQQPAAAYPEAAASVPNVKSKKKKLAAILIGCGVCLVLIVGAIVMSGMPKDVIDKPYLTDIMTSDGTYKEGTYTGKWKNNMPYGSGTFTYGDGMVYSGEWKNGKADGQGKLTDADGFVYEGEWKNNRYDGQGKITYAEDDESNRVSYEGEFKDGKKDGQGTMKWNNGQVYEGEWKDNDYNGYGKKTYGDNENGIVSYEGNWKDGQKDGQGTMEWNDGQVYEGEWKDNDYNGYGKLTYAKDNESGIVSYEGNWKDGQKDGQGTMKWNDGQVYEGEWKDNRRNGQGKQTYAKDDESGIVSYEGNWKDGQKDGQGTMKWNDGQIYEGEWKDDDYNGYGKLTYGDNEYGFAAYEGNWKNGEMDGKGTLKYTDGSVYECVWENGELIEDRLSTQVQQNSQNTSAASSTIEDEEADWTDVLGKSPEEAVKILERYFGVSLSHYYSNDSSYRDGGYNTYYTSKTNSAIPVYDTIYFNSIELDYTSDNVVYNIGFHYSGSSYVDEYTYHAGAECIEVRNYLYEDFSEVFGEPYETGDYEEYIMYTWKGGSSYDLWLCGGENLWGIEGYNEVIFSLTDNTLKPEDY